MSDSIIKERHFEDKNKKFQRLKEDSKIKKKYTNIWSSDVGIIRISLSNNFYSQLLHASF